MDVQVEERQGVRLAIEGCGHGTLHAIYSSVNEACKRKGWSGIDLLIIGGDFQSVRNEYDLNCVSMPAKYRAMGDFHEYYSGRRRAPWLTVFVGGNHEATNYLFELYYGGWVAPNIYYMGAANVLRFGPLRIAGLSGIWKHYNYRRSHHERLPYSQGDIKSIYDVREIDVRKLMQVKTQVDIGISHDWPRGVEWLGNFKHLFRIKQHFVTDAQEGQLGSVAAKSVMDWLRPRFWFSAHLHCKYAAVIQHGQRDALQRPPLHANGQDQSRKNQDEVDLDTEISRAKNEDELDLDLDDDVDVDQATVPLPSSIQPTLSKAKNLDEIDIELEDDTDGIAPVAPGQGLDNVQVPVAAGTASEGGGISVQEARAALPAAFNRPSQGEPERAEPPPDITNDTTRFLALDKCLPNRHFLQLLPVSIDATWEGRRPFRLEYDREWLAITRAFALHEPLVLGDSDAWPPSAKTRAEYKRLVDEQATWVEEHLLNTNILVPENFEVQAPIYDNQDWAAQQYQRAKEYPNAQTAKFCELLHIPNAFEISAEEIAARMEAGAKPDPERHGGGRRGDGGFRRGNQGHAGGRGGHRGRGRGGRGGGGGRSGWKLPREEQSSEFR